MPTLYALCGVATSIGAPMAGLLVDRYGGPTLTHHQGCSIPSTPPYLRASSATHGCGIASISGLPCTVEQRIESILGGEDEARAQGSSNGVHECRGEVSAIPGPLPGTLLWKISPRIVFVIPAAAIPVGIAMLLATLKIDKKPKLPAEELQHC